MSCKAITKDKAIRIVSDHMGIMEHAAKRQLMEKVANHEDSYMLWEDKKKTARRGITYIDLKRTPWRLCRDTRHGSGSVLGKNKDLVILGGVTLALIGGIIWYKRSKAA